MADSPLSDADSLSSAGASTEPLPGSDPAPISPVKRTLGPSRRNTGKGGGGNESDSSLTEQDSSDNERDEDEEELEGGGRGGDREEDTLHQMRKAMIGRSPEDEMDHDRERAEGGGAGEGDLRMDEDEHPGEEDLQPTPRVAVRPYKKRMIMVDSDYSDEVEDELADRKRAYAQSQLEAVMRAVDGNGATGSEHEEVDELSDVSMEDESAERDDVSGQPPTKRLRRGGPSVNGSIISSSTANGGRHSRAGSFANSLSDLEDEVNPLVAAIKSQEQEQQEESSEEPIKPEEAGSDAVDSDVPISKKGTSGRGGRGRGGTTKSRGARGGAKKPSGTARAGPTPQERPRSMSPSGRSDSPLSVVSSSDGAALQKAIEESKVNGGETATADETNDQGANVEEAESVKGKPGKPANDYATGRSARGRGRGRARYRPPRRRHNLSAPSISRSDSNGSSSETADNLDMPLVNGNSAQAPNLPEPSGLVELDVSQPARLVDQLDEMTDSGARPIDSIALNGTHTIGAEAKKSEEETPSREEEREVAPSKEKQQKEDKREPVKRAAPASAKKGAKKGGKKGKGKEKAIDQDVAADDDELANDSDHEEDTSDASFMRKRGEAMEHLTKIEIQFAKLRDMLYVERMTEVEKDRIAIESGSHPELIHLTQLLELRRNKRLELAKAWLDGLEASYDRQYFSDEHAMWNQWENQRAELRTKMLDEANSKRRRLDREKRALERPKDDTLASILAPRAPPAVPLHHRRRLGFEGEPLVENEIAWALRNPDVRADPSLSGLDDADAYADLERMGLREPIGHPGMYPYDSIYGPAPGHLWAFADPRTAHLAPGFPYSAYDPAAIAMQSHSYAAAAAAAAAAATPATFSSLPPLPGREQQPPSRPSSNPRHPNYPGEAPQQHAYNAASNRIYPYSNYPESMAAESIHGQHGSWPGKPSLGGAYGFEDERRRTMSAGGTLGPSESLDSIAGSRQSGGGANGHDDPMTGPRTTENGGRTTPVGGSNPKPRLTLDDHMSHRSPKATTSVAKAVDRAGSGRSSPASFMAIPTIPPFDRHRHEMAIAAARANSPLHTKPSQPSLYPHSPATDQQGQYVHHSSTNPSAAQRAGFM